MTSNILRREVDRHSGYQLGYVHEHGEHGESLHLCNNHMLKMI